MRRPTSLDIAAISGVSQATVSRALSQSPLVNDETRRRVLSVAKSLNYKVDANARKMRSKKIHTIAVLISTDLSNLGTGCAKDLRTQSLESFVAIWVLH